MAETSMKVHELAKSLKLTSKDVLAKLAEYGIEIKSHLSVLTEEQATMIFEIYTQICDDDFEEIKQLHNKLIKKTIAVTYIHNDSWKYFTPKCYKESFKKTISNMKNGKETKIVVIGDSVSVGYTSSKSANINEFGG